MHYMSTHNIYNANTYLVIIHMPYANTYLKIRDFLQEKIRLLQNFLIFC